MVTSYVRTWFDTAFRILRVENARLWHRAYWIRHRFVTVLTRHSVMTIIISVTVLMGFSGYWLSELQETVEPHFKSSEMLGTFRSLLLGTGGAMIGAAAIAFSLVMFAIQVNVGRMPHMLFRKLSSDWRLLGSFAATFAVAISVGALSLIPDQNWVGIAIGSAIWGIILILLLFLYAYRRALSLISPMRQIQFVVAAAQYDMRGWARRAQRAAPLLEGEGPEEADPPSPRQSTHDTTRYLYLDANPHWTYEAQRAVTHAITFARRYAADGDHEVSSAALSAVVHINAAYIEAKGKTFFAHHALMDNPLATDGFINETLENLRQNLLIGVARRDEIQIEQTIRAMAQLVQLYAGIDYSNEYASKSHAHIAAQYLSSAADAILPHGMTDVLMEWMRLMGECATFIAIHSGPDTITPLTDKIGVVAGVCITKEAYRPVTLAGMEQLAQLTFTLIRHKEDDLHFSLGNVKENISFVAKIVLKVPDTLLSNVHQTYLGPYYGISTEALQQRLTELANAISDAPADDHQAQAVIQNIEQWAEELNSSEKEIFLIAIEQKSNFIFDIIHWIGHVTKLLLFVSNAPACSDHARDKLRKHALWLFSVLSWVPDGEEASQFVENFGMTETLFEVSLSTHHHNCVDFTQNCEDILLGWAFKAGKYKAGWVTISKSICALAALSAEINDPAEEELLKESISKKLYGPNPITEEGRNHAAREIRRRAANLRSKEFSLSAIDIAMSRADHKQIARLLNEIADILSPDTAGEHVEIDMF